MKYYTLWFWDFNRENSVKKGVNILTILLGFFKTYQLKEPRKTLFGYCSSWKITDQLFHNDISVIFFKEKKVSLFSLEIDSCVGVT